MSVPSARVSTVRLALPDGSELPPDPEPVKSARCLACQMARCPEIEAHFDDWYTSRSEPVGDPASEDPHVEPPPAGLTAAEVAYCRTQNISHETFRSLCATKVRRSGAEPNEPTATLTLAEESWCRRNGVSRSDFLAKRNTVNPPFAGGSDAAPRQPLPK